MSSRDTQSLVRNQRKSYFDFPQIENIFLSWISDIIKKSEKSQFKQEDHLNLKPDLTSSFLMESFQSAWDSSSGHSHRLLYAFYTSLRSEIKQNILLQGISGLTDFVLPFFIFITTIFSDSSYRSVVLGIILLTVMFLIKIVSGLVMAHTRIQSRLIGEKFSINTISLIYNKLLRTPYLGNHEFNQKDVFKFVEEDSIKLRTVMEVAGGILVLPFKLFFGLVIIYWMIGAYMIPMGFVLGGIFWLNTKVTGKFDHIKEDIERNREKRVKITEEILSGIRYIKMSGFENIFAKMIYEKRAHESSSVKVSALGSCFLIFSSWLTPILLGVVIFGLYVLAGNMMNAKIAFITLASYEIIAEFLEIFPEIYKRFHDIRASTQKIDKFLTSRDIETRSYFSTGPQNTKTAIKIVEGNFRWGNDDNGKSYTLPSESSRHQETEMEFIDSERKEFLLKGINLEIDKGELIVIIGE